MRKHIIIFLILLMAALPVWSASMVCHHVQKMPQAMDMQASGHTCCLDMQKQQTSHSAADTCHCDQFQHGQFILSLPDMPVAAPASIFIATVLPLQALPERPDVLYRPPIA
jgi:hypothetical protein